jgi:serine/threonine protein kinase
LLVVEKSKFALIDLVRDIASFKERSPLELPVGTKSVQCPSCERLYPSGCIYCPQDAYRLAAPSEVPRGYQKRCPMCKRDYKSKVVVCPHDGTLLMVIRQDTFPQLDFGPYEIVKSISKRFRSQVFEGCEIATKAPVAIKLLDQKPSDEGFQHNSERFLRQFSSHKTLSHPNIVAIKNQGRTASGQIYLVFELVPKAFSLANLQGQLAHLSVNYFLEIFHQLTDALAYAHSVEIYHHDLAPSDILIEESANDSIKIRVTDFAKGAPLLHGDNRNQQFTERGDLFGHPQFLSPEVCRGAKTDALSNIYSIGCIMFWLLTRTKPFNGSHWVAILLNKIDGQRNELLVKSENPEFQLLKAIVEKCMEHERKNRYQSLDELRAALAAVPKNGEPVSYARLTQLLREYVED